MVVVNRDVDWSRADYSNTPPNTKVEPIALAIAITSFASCLLLILPLTTRTRAGNWPLVAVLTGTFITAFLQAINASVWPSFEPPFVYDGKGLCEAEAKILVARDVLIPGGLICTFRQISMALNPSRFGVQPSTSDRRRTWWFNMLFCVLLPLLSMPLSYVAQATSASLAGVVGCIVPMSATILGYILVLVWPFAMSLIAVAYGVLAGFRMVRHQKEISGLLSGRPGLQKQKETRPRHLFSRACYSFCDYPSRSTTLSANKS